MYASTAPERPSSTAAPHGGGRITDSRHPWLPAALEWLALALAVALLALDLTSPDPRIGDDDFGVFYAGAAAFASGQSPYVGDFVSPPWFVLLLAPLTALPLPAARALWLALNLALLFGTTAICLRLIGVAWPWRRLALAATVFALWPPVLFGLKLGQNSLLVWLLLLLALLAAQRGRPTTAGILLVVAFIKPQLAALFAAGLAVWAAQRGDLRRLSLASAATLAVLALAVLFVAPASYADLLAGKPRTWNYWGSTVALPPLLAELLGSQPMALMIWAVAASFGAAAVMRVWLSSAPPRGATSPSPTATSPPQGSSQLSPARRPLTWPAVVTACATLLLTLYAYPYDAILLQLPLLWLVAQVTTHPQPNPAHDQTRPGQERVGQGLAPCRPARAPAARSGQEPLRYTSHAIRQARFRRPLLLLALAVLVLWSLEPPADYTIWRHLGLLPPLALLGALLAAGRGVS
jgi:hypothetical protein